MGTHSTIRSTCRPEARAVAGVEIGDRERRDLCPAHGRAHTASFLQSLCGPDWPLLIAHPHRQETRP